MAFFSTPSDLIGMLSIVGVLLFGTRWRATGKRWATAGVALLMLFGFSPFGSFLLLPCLAYSSASRCETGPHPSRHLKGASSEGGSLDLCCAQLKARSR